jgi:hypothetical protein
MLVSHVADPSNCFASDVAVASLYQNWLEFQSSANMVIEKGYEMWVEVAPDLISANRDRASSRPL